MPTLDTHLHSLKGWFFGMCGLTVPIFVFLKVCEMSYLKGVCVSIKRGDIGIIRI